MKNEQHSLTRIILNNIGKKFRGRWIFRNINLEILQGERIAVTGGNGSGKSTFIQLVSGYIIPSEGEITWMNEKDPLPADTIFKQLAFAAPYMELIEEFTLDENISFYVKRKQLNEGITAGVLTDVAMLKNGRSGPIRNFSSGMKQRLKLALAVYTKSPLLLLDEPLSNLDAAGYAWYREIVNGIDPKRTVIVCSNQEKEEAWFCGRTINIEDYK